MMLTALLLATTVTAAEATAKPTDGPFGFVIGTTKADIEKTFPLKAEQSAFSAAGAPKAHPAFERYLLFFGDATGLCKVAGIGKDVETSAFGTELSGAFDGLLKALEDAYGPAENYSRLQPGSIWHEPREYMMGLIKKERTLMAIWTTKKHPLKNGIQSILLKGGALSLNKGYLSLAYEFENFDACMKEHNDATNKAL